MNLYDKASLIITPNAYKAGKIYAAKPTSGAGDLTFARASAQTRRNSAGIIENLANNVPALDYPVVGGCPWWSFPVARTNGIRNNSMVGAVAGAPGTIPTNWFVNSPAGISTEVVGVGLQEGIAYIDIRFFGTGSTQGNIIFEQSGIIPALNGQTWTNSFWFQVIAGSAANCTLQSRIAERNSGGGAVTEGLQTIASPTSWLRNTFTRTLSGGGTVASVVPAILLTFAAATHDFTLRVGLPQLEQAADASPVIITSGSALTRVIANPNTSGLTSFIGQTEGTWYTEFRTQSFLPAAADLISLGSAVGNNVVFFVSGGTLRVNIYHNSAVILVNSGITLAANTTYKCAIRYQSGNILLSVNGSSFTSVSTFAFSGALNDLTYTSSNFFGERLPCLFGENSFYPALTNAEINALTTRP